MYSKPYAKMINFAHVKGNKERAQNTSLLVSNAQDTQANIKVLMIEDERICQIIQRRLLEDFGCDVTIAQTGEQGLAMYNESFDLVILDINLPGISGLVVSQAIRSIPQGRNVPIIGLSSEADGRREECILAGYNEVMAKPADVQELKTLLQMYTSRE